MKNFSVGGLIWGLLASALTIGLMLAVEYVVFEEFLPAMAGSSMTSAERKMIVDVVTMLKKVFIGMGAVNAVISIFAGHKWANVLLTILGIFQLMALITLISGIFNLIAAGVGRKHYKKVNG